MKSKNEHPQRFGIIDGGPDSSNAGRKPLFEGAQFLPPEEADEEMPDGLSGYCGVDESGRLFACYDEGTSPEQIEQFNESFRKLAVEENNTGWLDLIVPTRLKPDLKKIK